LTPGAYRYTLLALGEPSGGGPTMTVSGSSWYSSPTLDQYFNWPDSNVMEVPFFLHCIDANSPNGVDLTEERPELMVLRQADLLTLQSVVNIRSVELISLDGKTLGAFMCNASRYQLPTLPNGFYIVRAVTDLGTYTTKVFF
jgi:hypothetical protein